MEKNVFGYSNKMYEEIGIYIVCDNAELLQSINRILRKNGMFTVTDTAGRHHFLIDARKNPCAATQYIKQLLTPATTQQDIKLPAFDGVLLDNTIRTVMNYHGFDNTLIGTVLLAAVIKYLYTEGLSLHYKKIYSEVGSRYSMTGAQVERNIRYCLQKSDMWNDGMKNSKACMTLLDEVRDEVVNQI